MKRLALAGLAATVIGLGPAAYAHHAHPDFLEDQTATVTGTIERIDFKNPHVIIALRTAESVLYKAEWQAAEWLQRHKQFVTPIEGPVEVNTLHSGDRIVVVGSPHRDPSRHELAKLKRVERPLDGWLWTCSRPEKRHIC